MERFPRGSIPPSTFAAVATLAPTAVTKAPAVIAEHPPKVVATTDPAGIVATTTSHASSVLEPSPSTDQVSNPTKQCDLSTTCPNCGTQMQPEHAHYRCGSCGYRDSCCF